MSGSNIACLFTEGQITLPDDYQDRTVNAFTASDATAPAFNISRDTLNEGETLPAYIDRQLTLMQKHIKGWKQTERSAAVLGDALLQGECVHASFLRDGKRIWQQQSVFTPDGHKVLVFTMTSTSAIDDADSEQFQALLKSFRFNA